MCGEHSYVVSSNTVKLRDFSRWQRKPFLMMVHDEPSLLVSRNPIWKIKNEPSFWDKINEPSFSMFMKSSSKEK